MSANQRLEMNIIIYLHTKLTSHSRTYVAHNNDRVYIKVH